MLLVGVPELFDIVSGAVGSNAELFTNVNSTVFFRAHDGTSGLELGLDQYSVGFPISPLESTIE